MTSKEPGSKIGNTIAKIDLWILDRLFQPLADRLPERWSAMEIGMSLQVGSLVFSAVALVLLLVILQMNFADTLFNILIWCMGLVFYIGIHRMRSMVRMGHLNPFRFMLSGIRPISIPFAIYSFYCSLSSHIPFQEIMLFNSVSNTIFVLGVYFISCQPNPPPKKQSKSVFSSNLKEKINTYV